MIESSGAISRSRLSLPDLAITGDGSGPYSFTEHGIGRPVRTVRNSFADPSQHISGALLTQSVRDVSALPLEVLVQGASVAALDSLLDDLDDALFQLTYATTVTIDGVSKTWASLPTALEIVDGSVTHAHWSEFFEVVAFTIPVQPLEV